MISFDTSLLLYSLNRDCAEYNHVRAFFASLPSDPGEVSGLKPRHNRATFLP